MLSQSIPLQYSFIPSIILVPITHTMIIKLKLCAWSFKDIMDKLALTISLVCFVQLVKEAVLEIDAQLEVVTLDQQLDQSSNYRGPIDCTIHKSYQVYTMWAILTMMIIILLLLF